MSFTIGADPELICHRNGQFVPAHNFFKSNSSFGLDGCESTAEIRPGFSESPIDLTSKILSDTSITVTTKHLILSLYPVIMLMIIQLVVTHIFLLIHFLKLLMDWILF